ncbi:S-layer homology domain-containing protein [Sedimentibacter saalensis]|uniref:S-layer homology domain-containing protein n=1 Tax=Sedimentibacter saalensis TaxID=130788 RepID=UPI00289C3BBD|nr:S-layer homology domain-containing protein [Sedimentibacter saalensis]
MRKKIISWFLTVAMMLSLFVAMPMTASAEEVVCEIVGGDTYASLDSAIVDAPNGTTIRLLTNITHSSMIDVSGKSFTIDVNDYTLTVNPSGTNCVQSADGFALSIVDNGVNETAGAFNVTVSGENSMMGLLAYGDSSRISVDVPTTINVTGPSCIGVMTEDGGIVTVSGNILGSGTNSIGAWATGSLSGGSITIDGTIDAPTDIKINLTTFDIPNQSTTPTTKDGYLTYMADGDSANPRNTVWVKYNAPSAAQIGSTGYPTLEGALAEATGTETILLLSDLSYSNAIKAVTKNVTIDLNGFDLTVSDTIEHALQASDGYKLTITDANGKGGILSVSSVGPHKSAAYAVSGGDILITGNLSAVYPGGFDNQEIFGAWANGEGSSIQITGDVSGYTDGILSMNGAAITVIGDVAGSYEGANASYYGSVNVTGDISGSYALKPEYGGIATVQGNVTGGTGIYVMNGPGWKNPSVEITGNVTGTGGEAITAGNGGDIEITGDVSGYVVISGTDSSYATVTINGDITVSSGFGVSVQYGGIVTVNGKILGASPYLKLDNLNISQDDFVISGSYYEYSNNTAGNPAPLVANTVYIEIPDTDGDGILDINDNAPLIPNPDQLDTDGDGIGDVSDGNTVIIGTLLGGTITANLSEAISGTTINLTITPDSGKRLKAGTLKYNDGTDHAVTGTSFIMPGIDVTVTAEFESIPSSGGVGGGTSAVIGNEITVSTVDGSTSVNGILTKTEDETKIIIKNDAFSKLDDANQPASINAQLAIIRFDKKAIDTIGATLDSGDVTLTVRKVTSSELSDKYQTLVGSRPVYDLTLTKGGKTVSDFKGGHATVTISYTLKTGENPNAVVIYYLADDGSLKAVRGHYDSNLKAVVFKTPHFSKFVIGYSSVSFNDVASGAWYKNAVDFIAARGITTGTGGNSFSPDAKLTRGQFVVLLMNAYGISPERAKEFDHIGQFNDAGNTYYTDYLLVAKDLGIVNGIGNNLFAPEKEITRQEMFVMLYNALKVIDEIPAAINSVKLTDFNDEANAADWANEALSALIKAGVVAGNNNNLYPTATTTRAEIAQVLYNLLSK